jgi:hypothetical protein
MRCVATHPHLTLRLTITDKVHRSKISLKVTFAIIGQNQIKKTQVNFKSTLMQQFLKTFFALVLTIGLVMGSLSNDLAVAATSTSSRVLPKNGAQVLNGNMHGEEWLAAVFDAKIAYCNAAFAAFRGSPSQSYIISSNVQSLTPKGLCDRIDQYFSIDDNLETRLNSAAAIAPILFADTPLGTKYDLKSEE